MEVYAEDESAFVFHVNDSFYNEDDSIRDYWFDGLYARIYDEDGDVLLDEIDLSREDKFIFDFSETDMTKAGTYPVYITWKYSDEIRTSFNIIVKDWLMEVYADNESAFVFHINDELYTEDEFGINYNFDGLYARIYDEDGYGWEAGVLLDNDEYFTFDFSDVDMTKAGTYPVYVTCKYSDEIRTSFEIKVVAWQMEVIGDSENNFIFQIDDVIFDSENTAYIDYHVNIFDSYGNKLIYGGNTFESYLNTTDYEIDLSKVDMSKPGTYPVTVIYKENESIRCEFDIRVKNIYMEVLKDNEEDFIYYVGESFNKSRYDVKIYDDDKVIHSSWPLYFDAIIDTSEVDMNTPGTYTVYATHEDHPSVKCEFEITVKEKGEPVTKVYSNRADEFTFNVGDELSLDDFYIMRTSASGNVSLIVYFEQCTVDTSEVDMNTPGTYTIYVSNDTSSISTEFQITVESIETTTTATTTTTTTTTATTTTTTTTTTVTTENETPETTTTVTTLPQTGYSSLYNYMMLLAAAITTFGGYVMAKARKKFNNN
jgi:LPXTG-motif cell wall-anchored protein